MKKTLALLLGWGFLVCYGDICRGNDELKRNQTIIYRKEYIQNEAVYKKLYENSKKVGYGHETLTAAEWYKNSANRMLLRFSEVGDTGSIAGWPVVVFQIMDEKTCLFQWRTLDRNSSSWFYLEGYPTEELLPYQATRETILNPPRVFIIGNVKVIGKKPVYIQGVGGAPSTNNSYPVLRLLKPEETTESPTKAAANLTPEEIAAAAEAAKLEASFHIWTYKKGKKTFDARFLSYDSKTKTLALEDRDGNEIQVKPTELVREDTVFYKSEIERLEKERIEALTRVWTVKGVEITAIFVSEKNGKVTLRSPQTGKSKAFVLTTFSQDDLRWITEHEAAED